MRRPRLTPSECWTRWRAVLVEAARLAAEVEASGGEEPALSPEFRRGLFDLGETPFPIEGSCAGQMAQAFRLQARALIDVALPARRVAIAVGVAGSARALEGLWHAEQARLTQVQLVRHGAGD